MIYPLRHNAQYTIMAAIAVRADTCLVTEKSFLQGSLKHQIQILLLQARERQHDHNNHDAANALPGINDICLLWQKL